MNRLEKAVANLESKGIDCKTQNDTVYVIVDWNELELSDFEIDFQAGEYEENLDIKEDEDE